MMSEETKKTEIKKQNKTKRDWVYGIVSVIAGIVIFAIYGFYDDGRIRSSLHLYPIEDYLPFIPSFCIAFALTRKIKLSILVGLISFTITWVTIMIIIGWGIAGLMH